MHREVLMLQLRQAFEGTPAERRAVARAAGDLADSGQYREDEGRDLKPEEILEHLADAPEDGTAARWNWWMGALDAAYGGYRRFRVEAWAADEHA